MVPLSRLLPRALALLTNHYTRTYVYIYIRIYTTGRMRSRRYVRFKRPRFSRIVFLFPRSTKATLKTLAIVLTQPETLENRHFDQ